MRKYIISAFILFLFTTVANAQHLTVYTDLVGDFFVKIRLHDSSITFDQMGNIKKISQYRDPECESGDLRFEPSRNLSKGGHLKRIDGYKIEYDFFTNNISRIGDLVIGYDLGSKKISKIGDKVFKYNFASERVERIGNVEIKYDFFSEKMSQIGDVKLKYDTFSKQLVYIGNSDFEYEFDENDMHKRTDENEDGGPKRDLIRFSYDDTDFFLKI
ncbi:hypothetical protein [uncultured Bacteroides sp.]|uniref:hypothetical protein n=1 Tax=uncultured Bacteroides sp. TaxID=162156 RepID=UPI002AA9122E|nr:hypothetical protein [uncultured Bacteroides sp.]